MALDRSIAPHTFDPVEFEYSLPPIHESRLDNGLPVYWLASGVQEVVQVDWVFPAGLWQEPRQSVAHATAAMLKGGTSRHSSAAINEALEYYGAQLKTSAANDFATVTLYTLTRHLPALLPMVLEVISESVFPEDELEIYKKNAIQRLLVNLRQCDFVANQKIDAALFGENHPYGRFTRQENLESLKREDLVRYFETNYILGDAKIFMAGKVTENEVSLLNQVFGKVELSGRANQQEEFETIPVTERTQHFLNDPNGVQGALRIGRLFPGRRHPDYAPMVVLNTVIGGYFGSRLMSNIREDKGYTYGIYSALTPELHGGSLVIQSETGRDVVEKAVEEVYREMDLLVADLISDEELLLVKNYLLGNLLSDFESPFSLLHRWKNLVLNGLDEKYFNKNVLIYKEIGPAELNALARKYYIKDQFSEIVVI